ncbi:hypothetical protein ACKWTF_006305 [Chironomus riparius]
MDKKSNQISFEIAFNSTDDTQHCYETNGANVTVQVPSRTTNQGSSMVKLKNIIGYKWENKNYPGHLVAVHKDGKIIAYSIKVNNQGMVRLINFGMNNKRALIRGFTSEVLDLQFANSKEVIIGCIEETALHVYKLPFDDTEDTIKCVLLVKIENPIKDHVPLLDKISFCPYVPEENDKEDDFSVQLLVWVRGNKFECYSLKSIIDTYGNGVHKVENIKEGIVRSCEDDRALITCCTFSPDGTTLAIGSDDGYIRFYQIYFHETVPRCLHSWSPHDGAPISNFFFLDNHTQPIAGSSLWKYVVTLAKNNTEIKVSSCDSWKTLQTIQFKSATDKQLSLKAEIDRTSSYLILNDMTNRQLYVLQILKENALSQNGDEMNGNDAAIARVFIKSIAEFHLASTVLSYGISNASIRRYKCALSENYLIDELEDFDEENNSVYCVVLKLFMILPESLQECHILYQTALNKSAEILNTEVSSSSSSTATNSKSPALQLLNVSNTTAEIKKNDLALRTPPQKASQLNLLTPDSFSSPVEKPKEVSQEVLSTIFMLAKNNPTSPAVVTNKPLDNVLNLANCSIIEEEKIFQQKIAVEPPIQLKSVSGGSSPSREVRDIMLQADSQDNEDYYPPEDEEDDDIDEPEDKAAVLSALNALDVTHFKNIDDDDDDDEDDGNEEDDEDDEPDIKVVTKNHEWPQAPQFVDSSTPATSKQIETLSNRMNQMIEIMEQQSRYIAELRNEIYSFKSQNNAEALLTQKNIVKVEETCKKSVEQNYEKVSVLLSKGKYDQREITESLMQLFNQLFRTQTQSLETAIKDNIKNICGHKAFIETISLSILAGIQKSLEQIFKKSLEDIMIPSYEKITNEMFQEMAKAFTAGTKEYTRAFDTYMKQYGAVQFQMTEFSGAIHQIPQQVKQEVKMQNEATLIPLVNARFFNIKQQIEALQAKIIHDVKEQVKSEIQSGFELQKSSLEDSVLSAVTRSQAETPAPTVYDHQESIRQHLSHGQINKAFHQALISNDLSLVEYTIEKADFSVVFKTPNCQLEQTVLLSLIQQITVDMSRYSELKNR